MDPVFYHGCHTLIDGAVRADLGILVTEGRIQAILPKNAAPHAKHIALPPEALLAPGYIDVQVNGGGGILFNDDPSPQAARHIAAAHRRLGTTGILPTLITSTPETLHRAAANATTGQGVLGIHFEGPFLSPAKPGVHRADYIRLVTSEDIATLSACAARLPVLLTLAPECVPLITQQRLAEAGIILSAGHSAAPFETVQPPITGATHIFNAMEPITARAPGLATAALTQDLFAGVILDGIHVHPAMLRLLLASKPANRILLVSDSMSVAGTPDTEFTLQGRRILRRDGRLTTEDGTLAGADLTMAQAVRNAVSLLGFTPAQAIAMATEVPAAFLRLSQDLGRIAPGLRADFTLLSPDLHVLGTMLAGHFQPTPGALAA
jgi:N-acetylglucosamine-6-phosphate deacetylase